MYRIRRFAKKLEDKPVFTRLLPILSRVSRKIEKANRGKLKTVTRDGIRYSLDLCQLIDSRIYYKGMFEPDTTAFIDACVRKGMVVIDVGANVGCHALRCARNVGPYGKVYALEATMWAFRRLSHNISLNNFGNIVCERLGISDEQKESAAYKFKCAWPESGVLDSQEGYEEGHVAFTTLDSYVARNEINKLDVVKIDVDGYECKVIRGAIDTLKRFKPLVILEMGDYWLKKCGDSVEELVALLNELGYCFYDEKSLQRIADILSAVKALPGEKTINVICK